MTKIFYIDLFSGAGGTTCGIHLAGDPNVKVVACVNHDLNAIESHKANHPDCLHLTEDIRDFKVVVALEKLAKNLRKDHPGCLINIWASLECSNYSKAKGGLPRDADSRTLAEHLYMYIEHLKPDYLYIENVREFMSWGPLDKKGRPVSSKNGRDYILWTKTVQSFGYDYDWQLLNAADYGAYTSRERYFGQFAKNGLPIRWPEQTHSKKPVESGLFHPLKKWKPVREVLDLQDEGVSIFARKKPLVENSLRRIYAGLIKFVAGGEQEFIKRSNGGSPDSRVEATNRPSGAITTVNNRSLVQVKFLKKYYSGRPAGKVIPITGPCGTITTVDHHHLVSPCFLIQYNGKSKAPGIDQPCPTIPTKDRLSKVSPQFLVNQYSSGGNTSDLEKPAPTVLGNPKSNLVTPWMLDPNYTRVGTSLEDPAPPILACRKHRYLVNPQYNNKGGSIEKPCFTLIARMDKMPPYLVSAPTGKGCIIFNESDPPIMRQIKEFMALYGIIDIKMRMLKIPELLRIQGFPEGYKLKGTKTEQKKYIGNAVVTTMASAIVRANIEAINNRREAVAV